MTDYIPATARLPHLCDDPLYQEEIPYEIWADKIPQNVQRTNVKLEIVPDCHLTDIRTLSEDEKPELEQCGFQWMRQEYPFYTGIRTADDVDTSSQAQRSSLDSYLNAMSDFLREELGCETAIVWDWRVRRSKMTLPRTQPNIYSMQHIDPEAVRSTKINSSHVIHADGSPNWVQKVISSVTTQEEATWTESGRYRTRVLTVWRPLVDTVQTDPLVCCDTRTVDDSDLDVIQKVMDDSLEESMYLKWRKIHRWYWMSNQTRDDVIVMNVWDSNKPSKKSASVAHCAMVLPQHPPEVIPRESIEVRFIVWNKIEE